MHGIKHLMACCYRKPINDNARPLDTITMPKLFFNNSTSSTIYLLTNQHSRGNIVILPCNAEHELSKNLFCFMFTESCFEIKLFRPQQNCIA